MDKGHSTLTNFRIWNKTKTEGQNDPSPSKDHHQKDPQTLLMHFNKYECALISYVSGGTMPSWEENWARNQEIWVLFLALSLINCVK